MMINYKITYFPNPSYTISMRTYQSHFFSSFIFISTNISTQNTTCFCVVFHHFK
ncbi:unnamed protein product [Schistosoma mattheei]|uniref:Uncharacterized protein n=1 Tax=Schistosoma mattheei TaxID=31246 RepID=A0A183P9J8_9TREM|nr:unnamed protein product [Schistosoma mattheei]